MRVNFQWRSYYYTLASHADIHQYCYLQPVRGPRKRPLLYNNKCKKKNVIWKYELRWFVHPNDPCCTPTITRFIFFRYIVLQQHTHNQTRSLPTKSTLKSHKQHYTFPHTHNLSPNRMCRKLAHTLLLVGWGFITPERFESYFDPLNCENLPTIFPTLDPSGLTLTDIVLNNGLCTRNAFM